MTDLFNFELTDEDIASALSVSDTENKQRARAIRTKSSRNIRRIKSEQVLHEILPAQIESGEAWHILSGGDIDSLSFMSHLINNASMDYAFFSTWCMAMPDVEQIGEWLKTGQVKRIDAYVGEIFPNQYPIEHEALCAIMRRHNGRVCVFKNHSKIFGCKSGDKAWVVESSANINTNPRTENTVITADAALYEHHKAFFDGVKSFNRDFDNWKPT
jgi:hypothetical protein